MIPLPSKKATLSTIAVFVAFLSVLCSNLLQERFPTLRSFLQFSGPAFICEDGRYTTEVVSTDPLVIYINNFVSTKEAKAIINVGTPHLSPSLISPPGSSSSEQISASSRTSQSGALPPTSPQIQCLLSRARTFLGPMLIPPHQDNDLTFGTPQLVKYSQGEKFDEHYDWFSTPQPLPKHRGLYYNRVASFFVYLDSSPDLLGGETWFPKLDIPNSYGNDNRNGNRTFGDEKWSRNEEGGVNFKAIKGSAVFWVNLHANGTGDKRTVHAGLGVERGVKLAMNIWPRVLF
ncbi:hypothetical protein BGZ60DRAFT_251906 [Tricladium varicosporioides]|nr:hypothetical protein BGZ60DRAFT_251906 [Hymenoscyphus varicosporioides]